MKKKLLISFSGGRTSAYMAQWLLKNKADEYEMAVVFANTGKEREETLQFVQRCDEYFGFKVVWVEAIINPEHGKGVRPRIVTYETASRSGEPFEAMIGKHGLPCSPNPVCTRELKARPIEAYMKEIGWKGYYNAIGIRADEMQRVSPSASRNRVIYPLVHMAPTTKSDVNLFWSKQPFDLGLKSYEGNCDFCWKKSMRKLQTIARENLALTDWWQEMETKYENYTPPTRLGNSKLKPPHRFYRGNTSVQQIINQSMQPFDQAEDESKGITKWNQLTFGEMCMAFDENMDTQDDGCAESCEPFAA